MVESIRVSKLSSGLTVATDPMPWIETVSVGVWVGAGTRVETADTNGSAHFLEHMAFKGTTSRSARDIAEQVEAVGGHMNAYTGRESTAFFIKLMKQDIELGVDILADILINPVFDEDEFERERSVILQEIAQVADTPDDLVFDRFQEAAYAGQSIGYPVLGSTVTVKGLSAKGLRAFMKRHYRADNMVLCAAGAVDHDKLVALGERLFSPIVAASDTPEEGAKDQAVYTGGEVRDSLSSEQVHLLFGFPGPSMREDEFYTANVLSGILGGGMSSRLFQEIREKRGLAYSVFSFASCFSDGGVFGLYAGTAEEAVPELIDVLFQEISGLRNGSAGSGITAAELDRAKAQAKSGIAMGLESSSSRAETLAGQLLLFGRPVPVEEVLQRTQAVDIDSLARSAARIFSGPLTLAGIGPLSALETRQSLTERLAA
ncbi:MAG: pitrilysin family protein [Alphaproteobacteria bacterium]